MDSKDTEIAALERKLLIVKLIQEYYKKVPDDDSTFFWAFELEPYGLLKDIAALYRSLEKIKKELTPYFNYSITQSYESGEPLEILTTSIDDWKRYYKYADGIEHEMQQIKDGVVRHKFETPSSEISSTASLVINGQTKESHFIKTLDPKLKIESSGKGKKLFIQLHKKRPWIEIGLLSSGKVKTFLFLYNFDQDPTRPYDPKLILMNTIYNKALKGNLLEINENAREKEMAQKVINAVKEIQRIKDLQGYIKFVWHPTYKNPRSVQMLIQKKSG